MNFRTMETYFILFEVTPTPQNKKHADLQGALAHCVLLERSPEAAIAVASFSIAKYDWRITRLESGPVKVNQNSFVGKDLGLQLYLQAQGQGSAFAYIAWSRDGVSSSDSAPIESSGSSIMPELLSQSKKASKTGRCMHYDSGKGCNDIIDAHSIQKSRSLSAIAEDGHVYALSAAIQAFRKNNGFPSYLKVGISKLSTFMGFCQKHDNDLFAPIDKYSLKPTLEQVALYGYRSLCREIFVKENIISSISPSLVIKANQSAIAGMLNSVRAGNEWGLVNLLRHKHRFDESLEAKAFSGFRYVLFVFKGPPCLAFSGVFYPDYDFQGEELQNLADRSRPLDLITICTAPMDNGWGFLLAWQHLSSISCTRLVDSLAAAVRQGSNLGDCLFRMAIATSENLAISPKWFHSLSLEKRERIWLKATENPNPFVATKNTYLCDGLEGIANWEVDCVIDCARVGCE